MIHLVSFLILPEETDALSQAGDRQFIWTALSSLTGPMCQGQAIMGTRGYGISFFSQEVLPEFSQFPPYWLSAASPVFHSTENKSKKT